MQEHAYSRIIKRKTWPGKSSRPLIVKGTAAFLLVVFTTMILHGNWLVVLFGLSGAVGLWQLYDLVWRRRQRRAILQDVDAMSAGEFLRYAADLLRAQGYGVHKAGQSVDRRIDLLLIRGEESCACRLWHQASHIDKTEVAEALAGMKAHGCKHAMIFTNRLFTYRARRLARRTSCVLIDRDGLATLVAQYRQGHRVYAFHREETMRLRKRR